MSSSSQTMKVYAVEVRNTHMPERVGDFIIDSEWRAVPPEAFGPLLGAIKEPRPWSAENEVREKGLFNYTSALILQTHFLTSDRGMSVDSRLVEYELRKEVSVEKVRELEVTEPKNVMFAPK